MYWMLGQNPGWGSEEMFQQLKALATPEEDLG